MADPIEEPRSGCEHWQLLSQIHFESAKSYGVWLLSNVVLVIGAAAAAVLSHLSAESMYLVVPAFMFSVGVLFAMIAGFKRGRAHFLRERVYYGLSRPPCPNSKIQPDPRNNPLHKTAEKLDATARKLTCGALTLFGFGVAGSAFLLLCLPQHDRAAAEPTYAEIG